MKETNKRDQKRSSVCECKQKVELEKELSIYFCKNYFLNNIPQSASKILLARETNKQKIRIEKSITMLYEMNGKQCMRIKQLTNKFQNFSLSVLLLMIFISLSPNNIHLLLKLCFIIIVVCNLVFGIINGFQSLKNYTNIS